MKKIYIVFETYDEFIAFAWKQENTSFIVRGKTFEMKEFYGRFKRYNK